MPNEKRTALPLRVLLTVGMGNILEFYDFLTFSFFAIQIGNTFFPPEQTSHGLLLSLATFGVGFVTRPVGGIVIGRYGDVAGRRPAMILSFGLMGIAMLGLALTPSFASIGVAAPILLIAFRLLQGFALGGEVGPTTAFLVEVAPPHRRALYVALQIGTQGLAILIAGLVGLILSTSLSAMTLNAWGWRIAFLLGAAVVPVGLSLRRKLPETLTQAGLRAAPRAQRRVPPRLATLALLMIAPATVATYVLSYMVTYAQDSLKLPADRAFGTTVLTGFCATCGAPLSGILSDRFGRRPVMLCAVALLLMLVLPSYLVMNRLHSVLSLYAATAILSALTIFISVGALVTIAEALPIAARSSGLATLYAVAIAIFGGSTQFIIKWLTDVTGSPLAPAWYWTAALSVGGVAVLLMPESAPARISSRGADN
jgi:MFS transporter, MHS family, citrate/tricarballylate:H+ symporter